MCQNRVGIRRAYVWDAENRPVAMYPASPDANDIKVAFSYDYQGRRVGKTVYNWNAGTSSWDLSEERRFVWSGWLMLMELDGSDNPVRKYTWGLDLAGQSGSVNSLESAGGIGGLLAMQDPDDDGDPNDPNDFELNYVYAYDGNGNVGQLVKWELGYGSYWGDWHADRMVARYEYDPYGNLIGPDTDADGDFDGDDDPGPYAGENPFRFSTKYWDDETGLGCWPLRYYDPATGRWLNRDPIGEIGGLNLYEYVANEPTSLVDAYGRATLEDPDGLGFDDGGAISALWERLLTIRSELDRLRADYNKNCRGWFTVPAMCSSLAQQIINKQSDYDFLLRAFASRVERCHEQDEEGICVCTKEAEGPVGRIVPGQPQHVYIWDNVNDESCGRDGSSGSGDGDNRRTDEGPDSRQPGPSGHVCWKVPNSEGKESEVMEHCREHANEGTYRFFSNDCHTSVERAVTAAGLDLRCVPHPRHFPEDVEVCPLVR